MREQSWSSVELIDPRAMTIEPLEVTDPPHYRYARHIPADKQIAPAASVKLPGRPYLAVRVRLS